VRLLTMHNLTFIATLMTRLQQAIEENRYEATARAILTSSSW
jgi:queuine/archaeosine tRNA-ribosyltransferase